MVLIAACARGGRTQWFALAIGGVAAAGAVGLGIRRHRPLHPAPWLSVAAGFALFAAARRALEPVRADLGRRSSPGSRDPEAGRLRTGRGGVGRVPAGEGGDAARRRAGCEHRLGRARDDRVDGPDPGAAARRHGARPLRRHHVPAARRRAVRDAGHDDAEPGGDHGPSVPLRGRRRPVRRAPRHRPRVGERRDRDGGVPRRGQSRGAPGGRRGRVPPSGRRARCGGAA
jgi:hypothetical protein